MTKIFQQQKKDDLWYVDIFNDIYTWLKKLIFYLVQAFFASLGVDDSVFLLEEFIQIIVIIVFTVLL